MVLQFILLILMKNIQFSQDTVIESQSKYEFGPRPIIENPKGKTQLETSSQSESIPPDEHPEISEKHTNSNPKYSQFPIENDLDEYPKMETRNPIICHSQEPKIKMNLNNIKHKLRTTMRPRIRSSNNSPTRKDNSRNIKDLSKRNKITLSTGKSLLDTKNTLKLNKKIKIAKSRPASLNKHKSVLSTNLQSDISNNEKVNKIMRISQKKEIETKKETEIAKSSRKHSTKRPGKIKYLNKVALQKKLSSEQITKSSMVVIDLKDIERITWKEKVENIGFKKKIIKKSDITQLNLNKEGVTYNPYITYLYL